MSLLDRCFFNVRDFMVPLVDSLPSNDERNELKLAKLATREASGGSADIPSIIAGGSTQMGKTMFVVVGYVAAWFARAPLVCITTTVGGTKSLHKKVLENVRKLEECGAEGISYYCMYLSRATDEQVQYFKARSASMIGSTWHVMAGLGASQDPEGRDRGILFIADTAAQMKKAVRHITAVREGAAGTGCFGLLVDEADSMQRTGDDSLQLEQRLRDLKGVGDGWSETPAGGPGAGREYGGGGFAGPLCVVSISATLLPVLLKMYKTVRTGPAGDAAAGPDRRAAGGRLSTFFTKAPPSKYVGVLSNVWQPFLREGRPVFLRKSECTGQNLGGILDRNWRYPSPQLRLESSVIALFEDACQIRYSLLLDISVSRVNIEGASLRDKAEWLGNHFRDKGLTVITVDGKSIRFKLPGAEWTDECWAVGVSKRAETVEEVLNRLEPRMRGGPAAVFGYSQMIRGDSFRSELRVPTHMSVLYPNPCVSLVRTRAVLKHAA